MEGSCQTCYKTINKDHKKIVRYLQAVQVQDYFHHPQAFIFYPPARNHLNPIRIRMQMTVKRIETGTPEGDELGFFEKLFSGWLEMRDDNRLYLHYIISRRRNEGNMKALLQQWLSDGYDVRVVMPRPVMQHILKKYQFVPSREYLSENYDDAVEVWSRAKKSRSRVFNGQITARAASLK